MLGTMNQITVWKIALPTPLHKSFDYLPPTSSQAVPPVGARVQVPFGHRTLIGFFLEVVSHTEFSLDKLKRVKSILDQRSLFVKNTYQLCVWMSSYYHHPLGEVLMSALPKYLRTGNELPSDQVNAYQLSAEGQSALLAGGKRAPKQLAALKQLHQNPVLESDLKKHQIERVILNKLIEKHWVEVKVLVTEIGEQDNSLKEESLQLNQAQAEALFSIKNAEGFQTLLLAGVTGSGKTEVYLQAIEDVLANNKKVLVLIPEINLTPQTVARFERRFNANIALMHSGLTDKERVLAWRDVYSDKASIVIGTRSAIFAPLNNLGLIIVDEEHDTSFKSQSQMRYNARDMAVMRACMENIPVVLGSATPALESFYNVMLGRYTLLRLPERAGAAKPPRIRLVDLRDQSLVAGLSKALIDSIKSQLMKKKQVLIFLNRRGFAPVMLCHHCGFILECVRCDAKLIYHANPARLICHHCEKVTKPQRYCPKCHQAELITLGQGTEQLEATLTMLFPEHTILRIDRDTVTTRKSLVEKLDEIHAGRADILIGTQMLAKGHHFPRLGLSAVVDLDGSFFSLDFRAIERMAQLLIQVAGRAGRDKEEGEVIIQTHQPEHPLLKILLNKGYFEFMQALLVERKSANLPPFTFQVMLRAEATKRQIPLAFLQKVKGLILNPSILALGPMPALMEKKAGRFRSQLLLQSNSRADLKAVIEPLTQKISALKEVRGVRWSVDVDPTEVV